MNVVAVALYNWVQIAPRWQTLHATTAKFRVAELKVTAAISQSLADISQIVYGK